MIGRPNSDHVRIHIQTDATVSDPETGHFSGSVDVRCHGFSVSGFRSSFTRSDFDDFLTDLRAFEASVLHRATLASASRDFAVGILTGDGTDASGHSMPNALFIRGSVTSPYVGRADGYRGQLNFTLEIDTNSVAQLLLDCEGLFQTNG